jgi:hypothetical protein
MGLHYLAFMGRYLKLKEKTDVGTKMNSACMNRKNIVNNVGIFNDGATMSSIFHE